MTMDQEPAGAAAVDVTEQQVYLAIIDEAARRMGRTRPPCAGARARPVADARQAAFWALAQSGLRPATIARLFNLNHSTMVHGLARAKRQPQWLATVLPAVALASQADPAEALRVRLERALPPAARGPILAYLWCTLLGWARAPAPCCAQGLWLLGHHAAYRRVVEEGLRRLGYLARMDVSSAQREEGSV
jgi:hypothetical protein